MNDNPLLLCPLQGLRSVPSSSARCEPGCRHCARKLLNASPPLMSHNKRLDRGGRSRRGGEANFVSKCKLCSRVNSIDIVADSVTSYDAPDSNSWKTVVVVDCRGVEPVEFSPRNGWAARGWKDGEESGTSFEDVDLSEGDWEDYDDKLQEAARISEFESRLVQVK